jgi:iron complex outermembrane recepter protein
VIIAMPRTHLALCNHLLALALGGAGSHAAFAQAAAADGSATVIEPVVVTATRTGQLAADVPASVDSINASRIQSGQAQVNLSETLAALPGVVANNRQNYAQDLQISIRGFGARSTFGVRGLRVLVDGIPATMPDGQAQISHIALSSADRIEVLRGPFSALYGNSSGGVIQVFTQDGVPGAEAVPAFAAGSFGTWRANAKADGTAGGVNYVVDASRFMTDGYRDHSAASRNTLNAKFRVATDSGTSLTLVANRVEMPGVQDPMGLTRAQFAQDPASVDPSALQFDTRKSVTQTQGGLIIDHVIDARNTVAATLYYGERSTIQYQSIPVATQASPLSPGGVIDLSRKYTGVDARWSWRGALAGAPLTLIAGLNYDRLLEDRRGYQNFVGTTLGVLGALRRDETNVVDDFDQYAQLEWRPLPAALVFAGVRSSRVRVASTDHFVTAGNPNDSGDTQFRQTTPVAGLSYQLAPAWHVYASAGKGFETPTLNELAYRASGQTGLNFDLKPALSNNYEAGAKFSASNGLRATLAAFRVETSNEIVVLTNSGGRSSFQNASKTRRDGFEAQIEKGWNNGFAVFASLSSLRAIYATGFLTCLSTPCTTPVTPIAAGNRIPGVPQRAAYAELRWRQRDGFDAAFELRYSDRLYVNDLNSDAAPAYSVAAARVGYTWRIGEAAVTAFARVDNLFDRTYAGSVIVNEGNSRFFEPAPTRGYLAGVTVKVPL